MDRYTKKSVLIFKRLNMKCKQCWIKFEKDIAVYYGIHYFDSKSCRLKFTQENKRKSKEKEKTKKKNARESIWMLTRKLDKIFSEYIRRKYSDENWNITCISCDVVIPWQESHNCHWLPRGKKQYRFDEDNCRPGCAWCNTFNQEKHIRVFTIKQIARLGAETVDIMNDNVKYVYRQGKTELKALIEEFTTKLNNLK